jgi:hypothetical protein
LRCKLTLLREKFIKHFYGDVDYHSDSARPERLCSMCPSIAIIFDTFS